MNQEDNIGKKIRERLDGHESPVSPQLWEGLRTSLPPPSVLPTPFLFGNVWLMVTYTLSTVSIFCVALVITPGLLNSTANPVLPTQSTKSLVDRACCQGCHQGPPGAFGRRKPTRSNGWAFYPRPDCPCPSAPGRSNPRLRDASADD